MTTALTYAGGQFVEAVIGQRGLAVVDFGASGLSDTSVAITGQTAITALHVPQACIALVATVDHSVDEHFVEEIEVRCSAVTPGVGFTVFARTQNMELMGRFTVAWSWG